MADATAFLDAGISNPRSMGCMWVNSYEHRPAHKIITLLKAWRLELFSDSITPAMRIDSVDGSVM